MNKVTELFYKSSFEDELGREYKKIGISQNSCHHCMGYYLYEPVEDFVDLPCEIWELEVHKVQFEIKLKNDKVAIWRDGGAECHAQDEKQSLQ